LSIFPTTTEKPEKTNKQRLVRNSVLLFSAEAIAKLTALLIQIIAARYLGSRGYGMYSYAFVGTGIILNFIDHGLRVYTTREISNDFTQAKSVLKNILFLKKTITTISIIILFAAYSLTSLNSEDLKVILFISLGMILDGYTEIYLGVFRAFEKMKEVFILIVAQRILFFATGGLGILFLNFGIIQFSITFLSITCLFFVISQKLTYKLFDSEVFFKKELDWQNVLKSSMPICLVILCSYIYFRLDVVFLFFMKGKAEAGLYTAAFKITESLVLLIAGLRAALFPVISKDAFQGSEKLSTISGEAFRILFLISVPISAGLILISEELVITLYGLAYEPTALILKFLAASFFLITINEFSIFLLLAARKTKTAIKITLAVAILNITLNWFVIPHWGTLGAALVFTFTQLCLFILTCVGLNKSLGIVFPLFSKIWKPLIASAAMIFVLGQFEKNMIFVVVSGVCVYIISLILLRAFNEKDILLFLDFVIPDFLHKNKPGFPKKLVPKNIALIKLGARGDLILASPFFKNLKQHYPEASIKLLTGNDSFDVVKTNPYIDEFILVNDKNIYLGNIFKKSIEVCRILKKLRSQSIDIIFILHRAWQFNILGLLSGVPNRVGFQRGSESLGLTNVCPETNIQNETKSYLDLLRTVNIPIKNNETFYNINKGDRDYVCNFLNQHQASSHRPVLGIIPGGGKNIASGDRSIKRWPVNRYIELSKKFIDNYRGKVFLIGGVEDSEIINSIILDVPSCIKVTHFDLGKAAALINSCDLIIGNDCGPIHISNALNKPTISIFGPTDPLQWASLKENNIIVRNEIPCSPCYLHGLFPNCEHKTCLNSIGVWQVYKHLQDCLCEFSNTGNIKSMKNESFLATASPYGPHLDYVLYKNNAT
jgi:lipopolysaccharide heptosyltransferase II